MSYSINVDIDELEGMIEDARDYRHSFVEIEFDPADYSLIDEDDRTLDDFDAERYIPELPDLAGEILNKSRLDARNFITDALGLMRSASIKEICDCLTSKLQ